MFFIITFIGAVFGCGAILIAAHELSLTRYAVVMAAAVGLYCLGLYGGCNEALKIVRSL